MWTVGRAMFVNQVGPYVVNLPYHGADEGSPPRWGRGCQLGHERAELKLIGKLARGYEELDRGAIPAFQRCP